MLMRMERFMVAAQPERYADDEAVGVDIVFLAIFGEVNNPQGYCHVQTEPFRVDGEAGNFCQHSICANLSFLFG